MEDRLVALIWRRWVNTFWKRADRGRYSRWFVVERIEINEESSENIWKQNCNWWKRLRMWKTRNLNLCEVKLIWRTRMNRWWENCLAQGACSWCKTFVPGSVAWVCIDLHLTMAEKSLKCYFVCLFMLLPRESLWYFDVTFDSWYQRLEARFTKKFKCLVCVKHVHSAADHMLKMHL